MSGECFNEPDGKQSVDTSALEILGLEVNEIKMQLSVLCLVNKLLQFSIRIF